MARQSKILDEHLVKNKNTPEKSSVKSDLVNILIGMMIMSAFIAGLVFVISALLK